MFPIAVPSEHISTLNDWHGGQWSAFYSLASTGYIHNAGILMSALSEAYSNKKYAFKDEQRFTALCEWLETLTERESNGSQE